MAYDYAQIGLDTETPRSMQSNPDEVDIVMQAMKQVESGGNYKVTAKDTGYGAYQFMPDTWHKWSRELTQELTGKPTVLPRTEGNQDAVARWKVSKLLDEGYDAKQIASIWNSGSPQWEGKKGVNKWGVAYDVPAHVGKVESVYNALKTAFSPSEAQAAEPPKSSGYDYGNIGLEPTPKASGYDYGNIGLPEATIAAPTQAQTIGENLGEPIASGHDPASLIKLTQANLVDNPQKKLEIFAAARFPNMPLDQAVRRYFIKDGKAFYIDNDQKIYPETGEGITSWPKRATASVVADAPVMVGTGVGAAVGSVLGQPTLGGMVGAGAGEYIKQKLGEVALGDTPKTLAERAQRIAGASVSVPIGNAVGVGLVAGANRLGRVGTGDIGKWSAGDVPYVDRSEMKRLIALGEREGMPLTSAEASGSTTLANIFNIAHKSGGAAGERAKQWAKETRIPQQNALIDRMLDDISPVQSVSQGSKEGVLAARGGLKKLEDVRTEIATRHYRTAFNNPPEVDITPVISMIDKQLPIAKNTTEKVLTKVRKMLFQEVKQEDKTVLVPENRLEALDNVKKEIDLMLTAPESASIEADAKRRLTQIKENLLGIMDESSPQYEDARLVYGELSRPITEMVYGNPNLLPKDPKAKTILAQIADLGEDQMVTAPEKLFGRNSSEPVVAAAKKFIEGQDPEAWQALLRSHLQKQLDEVRTNIGAGKGESFRNKVFGVPRQEKMLQVAMGPRQFQNWSDFIDLLNATNSLNYYNSPTLPLALTEEALRKDSLGIVGKAVGAAGTVMSPGSWPDALRSLALPARKLALIEKILDPSSTSVLSHIKRLPPGPEKTARLLSLMGTVEGEQLVDESLTGTREYKPPGGIFPNR